MSEGVSEGGREGGREGGGVFVLFCVWYWPLSDLLGGGGGGGKREGRERVIEGGWEGGREQGEGDGRREGLTVERGQSSVGSR